MYSNTIARSLAAAGRTTRTAHTSASKAPLMRPLSSPLNHHWYSSVAAHTKASRPPPPLPTSIVRTRSSKAPAAPKKAAGPATAAATAPPKAAANKKTESSKVSRESQASLSATKPTTAKKSKTLKATGTASKQPLPASKTASSPQTSGPSPPTTKKVVPPPLQPRPAAKQADPSPIAKAEAASPKKEYSAPTIATPLKASAEGNKAVGGQGPLPEQAASGNSSAGTVASNTETRKEREARRKTMARRYVASIVALPILIVTSYYLFIDRALGHKPKVVPGMISQNRAPEMKSNTAA